MHLTWEEIGLYLLTKFVILVDSSGIFSELKNALEGYTNVDTVITHTLYSSFRVSEVHIYCRGAPTCALWVCFIKLQIAVSARKPIEYSKLVALITDAISITWRSLLSSQLWCDRIK
ncbi:MAG TPA: hypothetical protein V6D11_03305 [Waterburya sp.]